jgi:hypothetical protein
MREVTIPVTLKIGTLKELGMGSLKIEWVSSDAPNGTELRVSCGAGVGNPLIEGMAKLGERYVWAQGNIMPFAQALFEELMVEMGKPEVVPGD